MQTQTPHTNRGEECPDRHFPQRDALVGERSTDVIREVVAMLLSAGWLPEAILAEVPTLAPSVITQARRS